MFVPHGRRITEGILVLAADQAEAEKSLDGFNLHKLGPLQCSLSRILLDSLQVSFI